MRNNLLVVLNKAHNKAFKPLCKKRTTRTSKKFGLPFDNQGQITVFSNISKYSYLTPVFPY